MQNTNERFKMICPLNGKICERGIRTDFEEKIQCRWWVHLYGKDPQSEKLIDQWDCAIAWTPTTTTETAQRANQTSAEISQLRTENIRNANNSRKFMRRVIHAAVQVTDKIRSDYKIEPKSNKLVGRNKNGE